MILRILVIFLAFSLGFMLAAFFGNLVFFEIETKITIGDLSNIILAVLLGIFGPIYLGKWLDDKRKIKDSMMNDVQKCIEIAEKVEEKIDQKRDGESFTQEEKSIIIGMIKRCRSTAYSLSIQLKESFDGANIDFKQPASDYWQKITDNYLMSDSFQMGSDFRRIVQNASDVFKREMVLSKHKVNKL